MKENKGNLGKRIWTKVLVILSAVGITIGGGHALLNSGKDAPKEEQKTEVPIDLTKPEMIEEYADVLEDMEYDKHYGDLLDYAINNLTSEQKKKLYKDLYKEAYRQETGEELGRVDFASRSPEDGALIISLNGEKFVYRYNEDTDEAIKNLEKMGIKYERNHASGTIYEVQIVPEGEYEQRTWDGCSNYVDDENKEKGIKSLPVSTAYLIENGINNNVANKLSCNFFEGALGTKSEETKIGLRNAMKKYNLEDMVKTFIQKVKEGKIDKDGNEISESSLNYSNNVKDIGTLEAPNYEIETASISKEQFKELVQEFDSARDEFLSNLKVEKNQPNVEQRATNNDTIQRGSDSEGRG